MYIEIKTDDRNRLHRLLDEPIEGGHPALLNFSRSGDFYSLSLNTTVFEPISEDTGEPSRDGLHEPVHN